MAPSTDRQQLSPAQSRKLDTVITALQKSLKISDEKQQANLRRFADKYLRNKLGIRGTGPHSHGFSTDQRKAITSAVREAFGIKAAVRQSSKAAAPAKGKGKASPRKRSTRKSTSQLAGEQTAKAQGS